MGSTAVEFKTTTKGDWHVLQAIGKIDTTTASIAETAAMEAFSKTQKLALDMSQLEYISSAGLRILLRVGKKAKKENKIFVLCSVSGLVKEILEDSGTDMLFKIYGSPEELK